MKISFGSAGVTGHVTRPVKTPPKTAYPSPQTQKAPIQSDYNRVSQRLRFK